MFYQLLNYSAIACTSKSHPLIYQKAPSPIYITHDSQTPYQDDAFLEDLLKSCDLSGQRQIFHLEQLKSYYREKLFIKYPYLKLNSHFVSKKMYEAQVEELLESFIKKQDVNISETYPLVEKPTLKEICISDFEMIYNDEFDAWECENEDELLKVAKEADILYFDNGNFLTYISKMKKPIEELPRVTQIANVAKITSAAHIGIHRHQLMEESEASLQALCASNNGGLDQALCYASCKRKRRSDELYNSMLSNHCCY
ncbi:hypothetical protein CANARDRAFT_20617 [[Candida] arabinofermentans NRRL YB-2248]|uniref:Uncharacterized protein n=1 Tax=[Candida] arabinofermentans NRRL YB-2248 TaxID=983967 RepID=A0A1E4T806_9ASCO|nr:hypothetical protein CANARDRAFT_20617 [[Candida] arabinofermentans NRRL YB-2248]